MAYRIEADQYVQQEMGQYLSVLKPEVIDWLKMHDITYKLAHEEKFQRMNHGSFMTISFTVYFIDFEFDEEAVLFKLEWR